MIEPLFERGV